MDCIADASYDDGDGAYELFRIKDGTSLRTHGWVDCKGGRCVIHNPSDHHMRDWESVFNSEKQFLVERVCPQHFRRHPDPDSLNFFLCVGMEHMGEHACCGCCNPILKFGPGGNTVTVM